MDKKHKVTIELDDELYKAICLADLVSEDNASNKLWGIVQAACREQKLEIIDSEGIKFDTIDEIEHQFDVIRKRFLNAFDRIEKLEYWLNGTDEDVEELEEKVNKLEDQICEVKKNSLYVGNMSICK